MPLAYYTLTKSGDPQAICTLFEAESGINSCVVLGTAGEAATGPLFPDQAEEGTLTIDATGGTFDIGAAGDLEEGVAFDADSATIQAALRALDSFGATLTVTGDGPHVIVLAQDDPSIVTDATDLTGGAGTAAYVATQSNRDAQVLASPGKVVFLVDGDSVAELDAAAAALISDETAYPIEASGYPEAAI